MQTPELREIWAGIGQNWGNRQGSQDLAGQHLAIRVSRIADSIIADFHRLPQSRVAQGSRKRRGPNCVCDSTFTRLMPRSAPLAFSRLRHYGVNKPYPGGAAGEIKRPTRAPTEPTGAQAVYGEKGG